MYRALIEGTIYFALGLIGVVWWAWSREAFDDKPWVIEEKHGLFSADFARRIDGGCAGWTKDLAIAQACGNLMHWWAYVTISVVFFRLHPSMKHSTEFGQTTITLVAMFIFGCGAAHLISFIAPFLPVYRLEALWLNVNGLLSVVSVPFVAYALVVVSKVVKEREAEVAHVRERLREWQEGHKGH